MNSILFDIGGTKTRVAYSLNGESFEEPIVFETVKNYEEGIAVFIENIKKVTNGREIKNIVGGITKSIGWSEEKLKEDLQKEFEAEINIENDAAMAGLGEANFGAGKGFGIVAYITV